MQLVHDYVVIHFIYPIGYGDNMPTIARWEDGHVGKERKNISLSMFLYTMEDEEGFELVSAIPVKIDFVGESRIDLIMRDTTERAYSKKGELVSLEEAIKSYQEKSE